jgi:hypothetical protein
MIEKIKKIRRKTGAFYSVMVICAISSFRFEMSWPLAAVISGCFLVYCGSVSAEKILLKYLDKK